MYFETLILPTITNGWFYPLTGSSFIKSPKELNHSRKNLIDIQKINEKFNIWERFLQDNLILKTWSFLLKSEIFTKCGKRIVSVSVFLIMKINKNHQSMFHKILLRNIMIYNWQRKKTNITMFLSKILTLLCTIKHYIVIENIFVIIACNLLELHKY